MCIRDRETGELLARIEQRGATLDPTACGNDAVELVEFAGV